MSHIARSPRFAAALLLAAALAPAAARADDKTAAETIVGEVVDTTCYLIHEGKGAGHKECAITCTRGGSPAAILDDKTGRLVFALGPMSAEHHHGKRPDERLLPFVGERVKVRGRVFERGGARAVMVDTVEKADAAPAPAPPAKKR